MGSLSVTWDEHYRTPFLPLIPGVTFVANDDAAALREAVTNETAAVIAEPIQGEGGVRPLSPAMAAAITHACEATGALFIADEVQCGTGRTGAAFAFPSLGLQPDLVSIGKAIGSGMPVGAALVSERVASALSFGDHGTTYGGNLLACRAALYVLDQLEHEGLLEHVRTLGTHFEAGLRRLVARYPAARELRGEGLMWGLELDRDAAPVVQAALGRGLLINRTAERVIRMLPPYVITERDVDEGLRLIDESLTEVLGGRS
jgi:acetylornithine/succinyldiaminopimelate/putrescine aminotransferase